MIERLSLTNIPPFYTSTLVFSQINIIYGESDHLLRLLYLLRKFITSPYSNDTLHEHIAYLLGKANYNITLSYEGKTLEATPSNTLYRQSSARPPVYLPYTGLIQLHRLLNQHDMDIEQMYKDMIVVMNRKSVSNRTDSRIYDSYRFMLHKCQTLLNGHGFFDSRQAQFTFKKSGIELPLHWMNSTDKVLASLEWLIQKGGLLDDGCLFWEQVNICNTQLLCELIDAISYRNQIFLTTANNNILSSLVTELSNDKLAVFNCKDLIAM
ncbi:hypothetical protein [Citrobacter sp. Cb220]|uniref:hypothetical protein n=1 Tax=Citrobacter sp. Cb220 TaxID=2985034 RepID=UPI002576FEAF|nr:hypothetical protein [Citrobacter sp. Cb220]MDM3315972.1 hypothetical protein [Citrobacter sp. Cb220]